MSKKLILPILICLAFVVILYFVLENKKEDVIISPTLQETTDVVSVEQLTPVFKEISKEEYSKYEVVVDVDDRVLFPGCNSTSSTNDFRDCVENIMVKKYPNISRSGNCLLFKISDKEEKLCDIDGDGYFNENGEVTTKYTFRDYIPELGYFFYQLHYEGSGALLISEKNGERMNILSRPVLSPNGTQFITVNSDIEAQYDLNGFQLWQKEGENFVLKISHYLDGGKYPEGFFGMSNPVWVDEHTFYFEKETYAYFENEFKTEYASYSF